MSVDNYVKKVVEQVALCKNSDALRISEILAQNVLFYGLLLQREQGAIRFKLLLDLVGVQDPDLLQLSLERVEPFCHIVGETNKQNPPFVFNDDLMESIRSYFYGADTVYRLDQKLPHSNITGEDLIFGINKFRDVDAAQTIGNIMSKILDVRLRTTAYDDFFILEGTNENPDKKSCILAVMDDHSTLTHDRYYHFLIQLVNVIYEVDGSPNTLMVCPSVTGEVKDDINACRGVYAMWDLSIVHLLHMLNTLSEKEIAAVQNDMSLLFAQPIANSYAYAEGHVIENIKSRVR